MNVDDLLESNRVNEIKELLKRKKISRKKLLSSIINVSLKVKSIRIFFDLLENNSKEVLDQYSPLLNEFGFNRFDVLNALLNIDFYKNEITSFYDGMVYECVKKDDMQALEFLHKLKIGTRRERTWVVKNNIYSYGRVNSFIYLKEKHLVIKSCVSKDFTPLMSSIRHGDFVLFCYLIDLGVDVNGKGYQGMKPIHIAVLYKSMNIITSLLKLGVDVNSKDMQGRTPLFFAAEQNSIELIDFLIDRGAKIVPSKKGYVWECVNYQNEGINYLKSIHERALREEYLRNKLLLNN